MRKLSSLIMLIMLLVACGPQAAPSPISQPPTAAPTESLPSPTAEEAASATPEPLTPTPEGTMEGTVPAAFDGEPLPTERGDLFSAAGACTVCHTQMVDEAGTDVSTDTFWRASMMANSARDPYWRASVEGEIHSNPTLQAVIEDKCATCHMPMARFTAVVGGGQGTVLGEGFVDPAHGLHSLAIDGISCALCHQILEGGFGQATSFSGGYAIDPETPVGERDNYGPHPVEDELVQLMQASSGYAPVESAHVEQSELCATCHTLYTPYVDAAGEIAGEFPEQTPYLEWLASSYGDTVSCQNCHMPSASGGVQLSITGGPARSPFHQHVFAGGNAYMLQILGTFGPEMSVTASSAQFEAKEAQILEQLQARTARIVLEETSIDGSTLVAEASVANMTGHKFPTGFPARRVWIHLIVKDAAGQVIFESGAAAADGSIAGNDNDVDAATYEPHYDTIDDAGQVQIYESIMGNTEGEVTTTLLRGAEYLKDNRLLPPGFDKAAVDDDIAVYGAASVDESFVGGSDHVRYAIDLGNAQGPFTVTAELLYQSIGYRWADNLRAHDGHEGQTFLAYYSQVPNEPVVVSSVSEEVGE
jgi:hypothetical protein